MKIIRRITYEGTEDQLKRQMANSLADGADGKYDFLTTITVETLHSDIGSGGQATEGWFPEGIDNPPKATYGKTN